MRAKAYLKYKPNGVEWLGDVPESWDVKRLKFIFPRLFSGVSVNSDNSPTVDESPAILKTSCVYGNRFRHEENKRVLETEVDRVACPVTKNSLIISRMNTPELVGSCGYVERDFSNLFLPDRLWIARFQNHSAADGKFSWYLVISHAICALSGSLATGTSDSMKNLTQEAFLNITMGVPPLPEQRSIAAFLDRETGRVDRLVAKKQDLIERLKEKRTALISRTVTRGLPPAAARAAGLPENSTFKLSGLDWLDEVPAHWRIAPLKSFARDGPKTFTDGDWVELPFITDEGVRLIQTGNVGIGSYKEQGYRYISDKAFAELGCTEIFPNDVLICRLDGPVGRACLVPNLGVRMITSVDNTILKVSNAVSSQFIVYLLSSAPWLRWIDALCRVGGGFRMRISRTMLGNIRVPCPPLREQTAIAAYLDEETATLDALVSKVEEAVERLQEYRTALITAAVTGKIDVSKLTESAQ